MTEKEIKASTPRDDAFLELCQQYAELARRDEKLAVSPGEPEHAALERLDDLQAERKILLWRILNEAERAGESAVEHDLELDEIDAAQRGKGPPREVKEARKGAFIEQLGSLLSAPFRGSGDRRRG